MIETCVPLPPITSTHGLDPVGDVLLEALQVDDLVDGRVQGEGVDHANLSVDGKSLHSRGGLEDHHLTEIGNRLVQPLLHGHVGILVLDADDPVVADGAHCAEDVRPLLQAMTEPDGAELPGPAGHIAEALHVGEAVIRSVDGVYHRVLGVHVEKTARPAEVPCRLRRLDALPPHVAGIEVRTEG